MSQGPSAAPGPPGLGLLAQPLFVGREAELGHLRAAFRAAAAGQGSLVAVLGEPGIGKSSLCQQVASYAASQSGRVLIGHCYEAGARSRPYLPFVEALHRYALERDTDDLRAELGAAAGEVARIVPAVRERLGVAPAESSGDPEADRYGLLQGVTEFLRAAAEHQPLVLVLEDLHDADHGTLDLLVYLARDLKDARLLVVGTYRDVEVDRAHPLSAALAELRRGNTFVRVHLRGLSLDEVQRLLASISQQAIPRPFAELLHRRTEGNPLFAHELLRFVVEEGLVERRAGALRRVGEESLAGRIPEGLRDVVGKRLSRLSASTNELLSVASVIGREFPVEVLRRVSARREDELEAALEEAVTAAIVEEHSVIGAAITYRFGHAFFRQTLYEEIIAPRRIRLHQQVARVLEEMYARRLDEHAADLAEHYAFSSDTADLSKAVQYGEVAARRAADVFAYGEAAHQLERALQVQDLVDSDDRAKRCDLLLALGEALSLSGNTERASSDMAPEALALADSLGDRRRAFRACRLALDSLDSQGGASFATTAEYLEWAQRAQRYSEPESIERAAADLALALAWSNQGRDTKARALRLHALALARRSGDLESLCRAAFSLMNWAAPQHWTERLQLVEESAAWPREGVSARALALVLWSSACIELAQGERVYAVELWNQLEQLAERTRVVTAVLFLPQRDVLLAIVDGRLEEALALIERFVARADELGASLRARRFSMYLVFTVAVYLGRTEEFVTFYRDYEVRAGVTWRSHPAVIVGRALFLAHLGRVTEARSLVRPLLDEEPGRTGADERRLDLLALLLQAAIVVEHREAARALAARLACVAHLATADWLPVCVARLLGAAAALNGDRVAAQAYYAQALESAGKIGFRPEMALTHLQLAELRLEESDGAGVLEYLDRAIPELREMGMRSALERALALVKAAKGQPAPQGSPSVISDQLTPREREVADLLALGQSNRDIAEALVITEGTAEVHVKRILNKLGLKSRAQVAAWAAERGLARAPDSVA